MKYLLIYCYDVMRYLYWIQDIIHLIGAFGSGSYVQEKCLILPPTFYPHHLA